MYTDTEQITAELSTIHREKRQLQVPAYLWERYAPACNGTCSDPKPVAVDLEGNFVIDCCSVFVAHRLLSDLRVTEVALRRKLRSIQ
jgi:hypothetical protein